MENSIKNVVFDVGDVLVSFRYRDHMRDLGFSGEAVDFLSENMILTNFWHEMDMGIRTEKDAVEHFTALYPQYKDEILRFWADTDGLVAEYPYAKPLISGIKASGRGVYVLSNYPEELSGRHWPKFRFLPEADGYIISALEKLAKPDPSIYKLLFSRFGLTPGECLFIDDRPSNVEAAKGVGMQAVLFTGPEALLKELSSFGIEVRLQPDAGD